MIATLNPLHDLRTRIDAVDDQLLELLQARAKLAKQVGEAKRARGDLGHFHAAERERAILERLVSMEQKEFPVHAIAPVFQEIFSACLALEQGLRVAFLGPEGTYSHAAAEKQFGRGIHPVIQNSIAHALVAVEKRDADYAVVPLENRSGGMVHDTLEALLTTTLKVNAQRLLRVEHCLASLDSRTPLRRVASHAQALTQCQAWIARHLTEVDRIETESTAAAAHLAKEAKDCAAILSIRAAEIHGLCIRARHLADDSNNTTRFLVLGHKECGSTGQDQTSLLLAAPDGPGALMRLIAPFAYHKVNLTRIESHRASGRSGEHAFFLDVEGHVQDDGLSQALEDLRGQNAWVKILGSYPR
jgi:chorismate mutase / prephenate dehydratase